MGLFTLAVLIATEETSIFLSNITVKVVVGICFLFFLTLFYFSIMNLKRVDIDKDSIYVSNYFKTYRYPLTEIERTKEIDFSLFTVLRTTLNQKGSLGKTMVYLLNKANFEHYLESYPENYTYFTSDSNK